MPVLAAEIIFGSASLFDALKEVSADYQAQNGSAKPEARLPGLPFLAHGTGSVREGPIHRAWQIAHGGERIA